MSADLKAAAAGLTRCDLCHQWVTDLPAHGVVEHLGSNARIGEVRSEDLVLIDGRVVTITSVLNVAGWRYLFDSNGHEHRYHITQFDEPVRIISTADPDADDKAYRDEADDWDEADR